MPRPSEELFSLRLRALVDRDGRQGVADFYGVSPRTVGRWERGETRPQAATVSTSVTRRGRVETGPVLQLGGGRFSSQNTVYNPDAIAFVRTVSTRRASAREAAIRNATNPLERAMAEDTPTTVTRTEAVNFDRRLEALTYADEMGYDGYQFYEYFGYEDDWDAFRSSYSEQ